MLQIYPSISILGLIQIKVIEYHISSDGIYPRGEEIKVNLQLRYFTIDNLHPSVLS